MVFSYLFHPYAQDEYEASVTWYLGKSIPAAERFIKAVEYALERICSNPKVWRNLYLNYHEFTLRKYPFTIIYTIEADKCHVLILAVYHHKRQPEGKYR